MRWSRRGADPGPQETTAAGRSAVRDPGWAELPPLAGVLDPIEPAVRAAAFRDGLAAHTAPTPFLAPLGHEISPDAPAGLVAGLASPSPLPLQRRPAGDLGWLTRPAPATSRPRANPWAATVAESSPPEAPTVSPEASTAGPAEVMTATPAAPVLTSAPPITTVQRFLTPIAPPVTARTEAPTPPEAPLAQVQRIKAPEVAPVPPEAPPTGSEVVAEPGSPEPVELPSSPPEAPLLAAGRVLSAGGAPALPSSRDGATPAPPASATSPPLPVVQRRPGLGAPLTERPPARSPEPVSASLVPVGGPPPPTEPDAPLLGEVSTGTAAPHADPHPVPVPTPAIEIVQSAPVQDRPLVVAQRLPARPLVPTVHHPMTGLLPERVPGPTLTPLPRRAVATPQPAVPVDLRVAEPPSPLSIPVQRQAAFRSPPAVPLGAAPADAVDAAPVDSAPVQSVPVQPVPGPQTGPATPPRLRTTAGEGAPLALPAPRMLHRAEPNAPTAPAVAPVIAVQRAVEDVATSVPDALPELPSSATAPAVPLAAGSIGAVAADAAAGAGAVAGAAGATAGDLDALAGRLYDKIRYRLKAELRLDRERAGLITNRP